MDVGIKFQLESRQADFYYDLPEPVWFIRVFFWLSIWFIVKKIIWLFIMFSLIGTISWFSNSNDIGEE